MARFSNGWHPNTTKGEASSPSYNWAAVVVAVVALVLYLHTLHPGVGPYLDSIEYQITTLVLGVSHPPGYPLYTGLGRLFVALLPWRNAAFRLNLLSAVCSALTVALVQQVTYRLTRSILLSLFGALSLAVAVRFWYQANYAELYPLNGAFVAATTLALLAWMQTRRPALYFLSAGLYALNFGVNAPAVVLLPMWFFAVLVTDHRMLTRPRNLVLTALIVLVAAAQYLYVPLRAFQHPPFCNYCPENWSEVPAFLSGREWWGIAFGVQPRYYLQRWADSGYQLMLQFWPVGVLLGAVGLWNLVRERTRLGVLFLLGLVGEWFFVVTYDVVDWADFMHPLYILFAPLLAVGLGEAWGWLAARTDRWRAPGRVAVLGLFALAMAGLLVATAINNYPLVDQSQRTDWHAWARDLLAQMEPGSWVLTPPTPTDGFVHSWALRFVSWAENRVPDLVIVYLPGLDPPGPPPGYLRWEEAEPHLAEHPLYVIELDDERLRNYVLLPVLRNDGWPLGYRVVGGRAADGGVEPWVSPEEWVQIQDRLLWP
ncbi:MAG TPA: DUF2723 domain-containing protein [Anaerolineae bacterium]|nr:DUF2723 domain-containing protein [Anaerolineae bacterium]